MNFFRYLWLTCSGFRTYSAFLNLSLRSTLVYWAMFSALLGMVALANIMYWFKMGYPLIVEKASNYLPEFSIVHGQAFSKLPQPYYANTNQFPIILDLEDSVKAPEKTFPGGVILRKNNFHFWNQDVRSKEVPWNKLPDGVVNREYLETLGKLTMRAIPYFFLPIWFIFLLLGLIQGFLFTVLAGFLERSMKPGFTFSQLFNISIFAVTPGAIIIATYVSVGFPGIRWDLLYFSCYCFFLVMSTGACRAFLSRPKEDQDPGDSATSK